MIFDGKNSKEKGPGFKPGKPISVRLNRNVGSITWEIDGKEYKH